LAEAHYRQRQYQQAGTIFDELAQKTDGRSDSWIAMIPLRRAQILAHGRRWDEAFDIAIQIAERFPKFRQQHEVDYLLGRYAMNRAEFETARAAYERVTRSTTGGKSETAAMAQWMIGETYFMQKKYNRAIQAYHRVEILYEYPRWQAAALLQAGKCHEMLGRWKEAIELYSQILEDYSTTTIAEKAAQRLRVAQQRAEIVRAR
jgi:TolA-binding protein